MFLARDDLYVYRGVNPNQLFKQMSELTISFAGCQNCNIEARLARGSIATHPTHGTAIVTCFHGPVDRRNHCHCTPPPNLVSDNGTVLQLIEPSQPRDVAWLGMPNIAGAPRQISVNNPTVGEQVTVILPGRRLTVNVRAVVGRDDPLTGTLELDLDAAFAEGDSGSPVLNAQDRVIAIVRNTQGRCGFILERRRP